MGEALQDLANGLTGRARERAEEFAAITTELQALRARISELAQDVQQASTNLHDLRQGVDDLRSEVGSAVHELKLASKNLIRGVALEVDVTGSISKAQSLTAVEQRQISRAQGLVKIGDVAGARLVLEHALRGGNPLVAFRLAETYDPKRLADWRVVGVRPDEQKARELYQQAESGDIRAVPDH